MTVSTNPLVGAEIAFPPLSGRAEASRLALYVGGIEHVDARLDFPTLMARKNNETKWAGMAFPTLTLKDGRVIGESVDILRVIGKYAGLYPTEDHIEAAKVDNVLSLVTPAFDALIGAGATLATDEEKIAARKAAYSPEGAAYKLLVKLNDFLKATSTSKFAVGDSITIADLFLFAIFSAVVSGYWAGFEATELLKDFDEVRRVHSAVASHEKVKEWYALEKNTNDGGHRANFLTAFNY